jgi:hypothetical protein
MLRALMTDIASSSATRETMFIATGICRTGAAEEAADAELEAAAEAFLDEGIARTRKK